MRRREAMPTVNANGVELFYQLSGSVGPPLVLVHGAWWSHRSWEVVAPLLAESFRVVTYDRRGHSASARPLQPWSVHDDVADLAALIEQLELTPAWVGGLSSGAAIVLRLASTRPELLRGICVHEPALFGLLTGDPEMAPVLGSVRDKISAVAARIRSGDHAGAARQFVETLIKPGRWDELSPDYRQIMVENAPAFLQAIQDPEALEFDLEWIAGFAKPLLLTYGDQSPPHFEQVVAKIATAVPQAKVGGFAGAHHVPQRTHPDIYVEVVTSFVQKHAGAS
jgi:pimeloyl-ACP methyl ester carboxylesterase